MGIKLYVKTSIYSYKLSNIFSLFIDYRFTDNTNHLLNYKTRTYDYIVIVDKLQNYQCK